MDEVMGGLDEGVTSLFFFSRLENVVYCSDGRARVNKNQFSMLPYGGTGGRLP